MQALLQDIRYAFRSLRKNPAFTAVAVLTLALGIGANSAIYSVLDRVILNPAPWSEPERLVVIGWSWGGEAGTTNLTSSQATLWKDRGDLFEAATIIDEASFVLTGTEADPEQLAGTLVSEGYFRTTGMPPALGRAFLAEEDVTGGPNVVILSDGLWRRRFGGDSGVIGRNITLSGQLHTVVGVMPPGFEAAESDVLTPLQLVVDPTDQGHNVFFLARLTPGTKPERVGSELAGMTERVRATAPGSIQPAEHFRLFSYHEVLVGSMDTTIWVLFGAVGFVLLIACANVTNLLLGRNAARQDEIAIRAALGAGRGRLLRHLVTESILLALAGGVSGSLLAAWSLDALLALAPPGISGLDRVGLNLPVLGFTMGVSLLTGIGIGLTGAFRAIRPNLTDTLREGGRMGATGTGRQRARNLLIMIEAMLSVVLLVGAGLLIVSFFHLRRVELGFEPDGVYTAELRLPPEEYGTSGETWTFERRVIEQMNATPGVSEIASASSLPLVRGLNIPVKIQSPGPPRGSTMEYRAVSPGYFRMFGITLIQGRPFTRADNANAPQVAIVNETFARRFFAEEEPIGGRITVAGGIDDLEESPRTIVGMIRDIRDIRLDQEARPTVFVPRAQAGNGLTGVMNAAFPTAFAIRTTQPEIVSKALRGTINDVDPMLPILRLRQMNDVVGASIARERFSMTLLAVFSGLALLLTTIGIYGVVSFGIRQRTREIGLRIALGAGSRTVLGMVLRQGMKTVLIGVGAGLLVAVGLSRLLSGMVYHVSTTDPLTFAGVAALLTVVSLLACYIPARRATRIDPMVALKSE